MQGTYLFVLIHHFSNGLYVDRFFVGLAVVRHPLDTFHIELVRASAHLFVHTLILTIVCAIVFSDRMHDRTNDHFGRSRVRTPGLAQDLFCGSRVRFPDLAA